MARIEKVAYGIQQIRKAMIITTTILVTCLSGFLAVFNLPCVSDTLKKRQRIPENKQGIQRVNTVEITNDEITCTGISEGC